MNQHEITILVLLSSAVFLLPAAVAQTDKSQQNHICERFEQFCMDADLEPLPPVGDSDPSLCNDPQSCIEQLAGAMMVDKILVDQETNDEYQITNFVWSVRSFDTKSDFYMVTQYFRTKLGHDTSTNNWQNFAQNTLKSPDDTVLPVPVVSGTSPQSTTCTNQVVNSQTKSYSGKIGLTTTGPQVGASSQMSWSQQNWVTCPTMQILLSTPPREVDWDYVLNQQTYKDETFLMTQQWIWEIPWSALAGPTSGISFETHVQLWTGGQTPSVEDTFTTTVPAPFDAFDVPAPSITNAVPSVVTPGMVFTITGTNLYPAGISGVFIAGNSLDPELWFPVQDGKNDTIFVITPDIAPGSDLAIDVRTPGGVATGVSITIGPSP